MSDGVGDGEGVYHDGKPVSDYETKRTLMLAGPSDIVDIEGIGEITVAEREEVYFGPEITLIDKESEQNYRLIPHGFAHDPQLWKADHNERGYIEGWELMGGVSGEITEVGESLRCPMCGEVLQNRRERSSALVAEVCPHE